MKFSRFEKSFEKDGIWEVHTLSIKDAVMEDAGTYEVFASNRLGECAMAGTLAIVTEPPTFPVELQVLFTFIIIVQRAKNGSPSKVWV